MVVVDISKLEGLAKEAANLEFINDAQKNKQEIWIEMGQQLEAANYDKTKISTRVRSMIDKQLKNYYKDKGIPEKNIKFKSGHFDHTMKVQGWTDPEKNHSVTGQGQSNGSSLNEFKSSCYQERKQDIILLEKFTKLFQVLINELQIEIDKLNIGHA